MQSAFDWQRGAGGEQRDVRTDRRGFAWRKSVREEPQRVKGLEQRDNLGQRHGPYGKEVAEVPGHRDTQMDLISLHAGGRLEGGAALAGALDIWPGEC